ncbi:MAG: lytic transglycosylase domain-containing protein [Pseudomonadota bacterium]
MNLAHMMGLGMLCASSLGVAADDPSACQVPRHVALTPAQPAASKFSLALRGCALRVDAAGAHERQAPQLQLYDERAAQVPDAAQGLLAQPPASAAPAVPPLRTPRQRLSAAQRRVQTLAPQVQQVALDYDIDPLLLHAIAHVESRHDPQAVSHAGALGLMQVMPATARRFGVTDPQRELLDPAVSLQVGSAYLKTLQGRFGNNLALVLAAYNAGEGAVEKHGRKVPPYAETRSYVRRVLDEYLSLKTQLRTPR